MCGCQSLIVFCPMAGHRWRRMEELLLVCVCVETTTICFLLSTTPVDRAMQLCATPTRRRTPVDQSCVSTGAALIDSDMMPHQRHFHPCGPVVAQLCSAVVRTAALAGHSSETPQKYRRVETASQTDA